jgi:hypothetical protein
MLFDFGLEAEKFHEIFLTALFVFLVVEKILFDLFR